MLLAHPILPSSDTRIWTKKPAKGRGGVGNERAAAGDEKFRAQSGIVKNPHTADFGGRLFLEPMGFLCSFAA